jgi:hypothetical protein
LKVPGTWRLNHFHFSLAITKWITDCAKHGWTVSSVNRTERGCVRSGAHCNQPHLRQCSGRVALDSLVLSVLLRITLEIAQATMYFRPRSPSRPSSFVLVLGLRLSRIENRESRIENRGRRTRMRTTKSVPLRLCRWVKSVVYLFASVALSDHDPRCREQAPRVNRRASRPADGGEYRP